MLSDLTRAMNRGGAAIDDSHFKSAAQALLQNQFVFADARGMRQHYDLICKHHQYFENLFDALNYAFTVNHTCAYAGIVPRQSRFQLPKLKTLALLVLAVFYDAETSRANARNWLVTVSQTQVYDKLVEQIGKPVDAKQLTAAIDYFEQYQIVRTDKTAEAKADREITILPSIMFAIPDEYEDLLKATWPRMRASLTLVMRKRTPYVEVKRDNPDQLVFV